MEIRAGIDWFSASMADGPGAWEWCMKGIHALNTIELDGNEVKARSLNGYSGISAGGSFVGTRHDGYFVQISGKYADDWFDELFHPEMHTTRLDIQATVQYDEYLPNKGKECYDASNLYRASLPETKQWVPYFIEGADGSYSAYLGAASSKQRACIYNKDRQSRDSNYLRSWRYEVRFRNELAHRWSHIVHNSTAARAQTCLDSVRSWLISRGVYLDELGGGSVLVLPKIQTRPSDIDTKLNWLRVQVAPSISWLLERTARATIIRALGLAEEATQP